MKTPYLLGIITVLLFGSFAMSGIMAQAGISPIETIEVVGPLAVLGLFNDIDSSSVQCPPSHPFLIGGTTAFEDGGGQYVITPSFNTLTNTYKIGGEWGSGNPFTIQAIALCAISTFLWE